MKYCKIKFIFLLLVTLFLWSCSDEVIDIGGSGIEVIESFQAETGLVAVYTVDQDLLNKVRSWQGKGDYPGVDNWAIAKIPNQFALLGGLPHLSQFYTINQTILDTDTAKVAYWEMLQVKANPDFGLRDTVGMFGIYENLDTILVAISKVEANPCYGAGGAWQFYVDNFKTVIDTFPKHKIGLVRNK